MKNIPLLAAASHTLARSIWRGGVNFVELMVKMALWLMMATLEMCLIIGAIVLSLLLLVLPLQLSVFLLDSGAPAPLVMHREVLFFQHGHPTAILLAIYGVSVILAYGVGLAHAIRSGVAAAEQAKVWPSLRGEALLISPLQIAGRAKLAFIKQIFSGKVMGWDGMLAAPVVHVWKIALCCLAMPIHFAALAAMMCKSAFKALAKLIAQDEEPPFIWRCLGTLGTRKPGSVGSP